jgi:hypothetical protein
VSVFGGIQGGKTGILAPFQPLGGAESSTCPEFPDSLRAMGFSETELHASCARYAAVRLLTRMTLASSPYSLPQSRRGVENQ